MQTAEVLSLDLAREAKMVNELHAKREGINKTDLDIARQIGHCLKDVNAVLPGNKAFKRWVIANCTFEWSQARRYMAVTNVGPAHVCNDDTIKSVAKRGNAIAKAQRDTLANPKPRETKPETVNLFDAVVAALDGMWPRGFGRETLERKTPRGRRDDWAAEHGAEIPDRVPVGTDVSPYVQSLHRLVDREHVPQAEQRTESEIKALPEKAQARIDRLVAEKLNLARVQLQATFNAEVEAKAALERQRFAEEIHKAEEMQSEYAVRVKSLDCWLTKEEYQIVLGCLHPDREATPERKGRAFDIFRKLEGYVNPKAKARLNGW